VLKLFVFTEPPIEEHPKKQLGGPLVPSCFPKEQLTERNAPSNRNRILYHMFGYILWGYSLKFKPEK
jgi:hypothetical protein